MKINGTLVTEQGRILPFEFETKKLDRAKPVAWCPIGYINYEVGTSCNLTIDGKPIDCSLLNFKENKLFKSDMYKNAMVDEIEEIELDETEKTSICELVRDLVLMDIEDNCLEFGFEFKDLKPFDTSDYVDRDDIISEIEYSMYNERSKFKEFLMDCFELSNGYDGIFQDNSYIEFVLEDCVFSAEQDLYCD